MKAQRVTSIDGQDFLVLAEDGDELVAGFPELVPTQHDHEVIERDVEELERAAGGSTNEFLVAAFDALSSLPKGHELPGDTPLHE